MNVNIIDKNNNFYFIGIGGVSMSALAKLLKNMGKIVNGYDCVASEYTAELESLGIKIVYDNSVKDIEACDLVVYTDAIKDNNIQLLKSKELGKNIISRGKFLNEVCKLYKTVIAVSGCHGKTTCTAMLSHIFNCASRNFTCHIGGMDTTFSNCFSRGYDYFITEACEYNKNFLKLDCEAAVVLNSDADHIECYGTIDELKKAYIQFAQKAQVAFCLYGDINVDGAIIFGFDCRADYYAKCIKNNGGKYSFIAYEGDEALGKVDLDVYGKHNILNALAAIAVARYFGIQFCDVVNGLNSFKGVRRRFEYIGEYNGCDCIADYAHHPNEIKAVIKTAKSITEGQLFVVFQPHTYSRTKNLFAQFVRVLGNVNNLLIYKTFAAREYFDDAGCALTLSQAIKKCRYADNVQDLVYFIDNAKRGDKILFLGAGDIYYIAKKIIADA
jgi:UDP-N-acetylmuramate--alanine ligase